MKVLVVLASCWLAVASAIFFIPSEPVVNLAGQCPSGIPRNGLFQSCALAPWKEVVGDQLSLNPAQRDSLVSFGPDFTSRPVGIDFNINAQVNSTGCSLGLGGGWTVFQPLSNLRYAHYRMHGCARSLGNSRCRMVVRDSFNRVVDAIEVRGGVPSSTNDCIGGLAAESCVECADGTTNMTLRYVGSRPTDIIIRPAGDSNTANWRQLMNVIQGDEFTIEALDFPLANNGQTGVAGSSGSLPPVLEFVTTEYNMLIDIFSFNCSDITALPGQTFGDRNQFLVLDMNADGEEFCSVNRLSPRECQCKLTGLEQTCVQSDKGFVALPNQLYFLALTSEECGCEFDNICFEQVGGTVGYFGVDWIVGANLTESDFQ